jgi:hypothetical protein
VIYLFDYSDKKKVTLKSIKENKKASSLNVGNVFSFGNDMFEPINTSINDKPDLDDIKGLSPAIAIEQKNSTRSSRSTVATITEVYDYLRAEKKPA